MNNKEKNVDKFLDKLSLSLMYGVLNFILFYATLKLVY